MKIQDLRKDYHQNKLDLKDFSPSPFQQFLHWLNEAINAHQQEPNAMSLATANQQGRPSCRTVLMKGFDEQGLVFFTNLESRKARELQENPWASVVFLWHALERQVLVEGQVIKTSREEDAAYFATRPRGNQLSCWCSRQDAVIPSREPLEDEFQRLEAFYKDREIPLPPFWGGYRLIPCRFEFWQGAPSRLHDRFCYHLAGDSWVISRLSP